MFLPLRLISIFFLFSHIESFASSWMNYNLVNGCRVMSMTGAFVSVFPGQMCIFLENGDFLSGTTTSLRRINTKNEDVWEIKGNFHHQLNLSNDGKRILALTSDVITLEEKKTRQDKILILDLDGNIIHQQVMEKLLVGRNIPLVPRGLNSFEQKIHNVESEISHLNSIYEIPKLNSKKNPEYIREGNIIVNGTVSGSFILSPDLKTDLHHIIFKNSRDHWVHDVQITNEGNFLYFNNVVSSNSMGSSLLGGDNEFTSFYSAVEEIRPGSQKIVMKFEANPKGTFYSWICGSVQELDDDNWLISHHLMGSYIYSKRKKDLIATIPLTHMEYSVLLGGQQSKAYDLSKFLEARKTEQNTK